jgi:hypothetical protein
MCAGPSTREREVGWKGIACYGLSGPARDGLAGCHGAKKRKILILLQNDNVCTKPIFHSHCLGTTEVCRKKSRLSGDWRG